jgi:hypothetical protein
MALPLLLRALVVISTAAAAPLRSRSSSRLGSSTTPPAAVSSSYGFNAKDYGAVGDGVTDDTEALQRAIDDAQIHARELFIPSGGYVIHRQLNISCANPAGGCGSTACCDDNAGGTLSSSRACCTHAPIKLRGEGSTHTTLIAGSAMHAMIDFGGRLNEGPAAKMFGEYNYSAEHIVTDLFVQCYHKVNKTARPTVASHGLYLPGTHHIIITRVRIDNAQMAGIFTFFNFLTHVESCKLYGNRIGIHSGSTNLRVIASDFASSDIAAILIDAGNAIEIDNCCIEGNSGTPIIVSGGRQGAPFAIAVTNNYFEANNERPLWWRIGRRPRSAPIQLCTELLINGNPWNESLGQSRSPDGHWSDPVGDIGNLYPVAGVTFTGNQISGPTANRPIAGELTPCTSYAAVTAVAATSVRIHSNTLAMGVHKWRAGRSYLLTARCSCTPLYPLPKRHERR